MSTGKYESVASLQLWRELERLARDLESDLYMRVLAYLQGRSSAPAPDEYAQAKRARAVADRHFRQIFNARGE